MIKVIGTLSKSQSYVLSVGAFLETYISSIFYQFNYVVKVPGDIVWERARNNGKTLLDINSFQTSTLKLKYKFFRFLFTRSLLRATLVIVPSQGLYELCRDWGVPESRLILIRNSVSVEKYSSLIQNQIDFSILTICRLTSWKGVDELIRYCSVHNTKMAVAGDGPERLHLESMSKTLNSDVTFFGDISQEAIINLMKRSKIFVLNSYYEGLPHALVEARAAGLLSVARANTGSAEVITDDVDGYLIRPDRSLEETLGLALATRPSSEFMIEKAKLDSLKRFNKSVNFPHIFDSVLRVEK
jgi:glycosyltransferase involved in cell wall biosynthesis